MGVVKPPRMPRGQSLGGILGKSLVLVSLFLRRGKIGVFPLYLHFFHLFYMGGGTVVEASGQLVKSLVSPSTI